MRLAGSIPRRRMSSVNEVIVSSWAIFGSLTNVPLPALADEVAVADEIVERGADGQPREAEVGGELALGRDRVTDRERVDQGEHALPGLGLLGGGRAHGDSASYSIGGGGQDHVAATRVLRADNSPLNTQKWY